MPRPIKPKGRWQKGQSGNPDGRKALDGPAREAIKMARKASPKVMAELIKIALTSSNESFRIRAGMAVLDRSHGKPDTVSAHNDREAAAAEIALQTTPEDRLRLFEEAVAHTRKLVDEAN